MFDSVIEFSVNCLWDGGSSFWIKKYKERYDKMNDCDLKACESIEAIRNKDLMRKIESKMVDKEFGYRVPFEKIDKLTKRFQELAKTVGISVMPLYFKGSKPYEDLMSNFNEDMLRENVTINAIAQCPITGAAFVWFTKEFGNFISIGAELKYMAETLENIYGESRVWCVLPGETWGTYDVLMEYAYDFAEQLNADEAKKLLGEAKAPANIDQAVGDGISADIEYAIEGMPFTLTGTHQLGGDNNTGWYWEITLEGKRLDPKDNLPDNPDYVNVRAVGRASTLWYIAAIVGNLGRIGTNVSAVDLEFDKHGSKVLLRVNKKQG